MKIKQFEIPGLAQYAYVISSEGEAAVVDPIRDYERYLEYAGSEGLKVRFVTETHIHADFASGAPSLAAACHAQLLLSGHEEGEKYHYTMPHRPLRDGDEFVVGKARLRAMHTPGHTPEHLSFVLFDEERDASQPVALFSGDFLFVGGLGRPDLLGEQEKQGLAHELYRSLHERITDLPDGVVVYPGHGAGSLCGSGMSSRPESTLGYERATQPLFQLAEQAFVNEVLASVPPMPAYYPRMKALNAEGALDYKTLPALQPLSPDEMQQHVEAKDCIILDLRRPEGFGGAHIPGAINIGAGQNLSMWAGWMLDPAKPILLVSDTGEDQGARAALLRVGLDKVVGYLAKGLPAWIEKGLAIARTTQVSTDEVQSRSPESVVLDIRTDEEWAKGHIQGANHIMLGDLPERTSELPSDQPIITVCGSGYRSSIAASLLQLSGRKDVSSMDGGMTAWQSRKLPLIS